MSFMLSIIAIHCLLELKTLQFNYTHLIFGYILTVLGRSDPADCELFGRAVPR